MNRQPFNYADLGSRNLPAMVFFHGLFGSLGDWMEMVFPLQKYFRCILIDLPGHGGTMGDNFSSLASNNSNSSHFQIFNFHFKNFLLSLKATPAHLVGYSMGGRLALSFAMEYPQHLRSLFLESSNPGVVDPDEKIQRLQSDQSLLKNVTTDKFSTFLLDWYRQKIFGTLSLHPKFPALLKKRETYKNHLSYFQWSLAHYSVGLQPNYWPRLPHFSKPLLYLSGKEDTKYDEIGHKISLLSSQNLKHVFHLSVPHCGHNVHFTNPAYFQDSLLAFSLQFSKK